MASRSKFENSNDIGCFIKLTNSYCLVASGGSDSFYSSVDSEVKVPCIPCTIAGCKIVGRMVAGNKNGLLVPDTITDEEEKLLKEHLPNGVKFGKISDKLQALGNVIVCNDKVALIHPEMEDETSQII